MNFLLTVVFRVNDGSNCYQHVWAASIEINGASDVTNLALILSEQIGNLIGKGTRETRQKYDIGKMVTVDIVSHNVVRVL